MDDSEVEEVESKGEVREVLVESIAPKVHAASLRGSYRNIAENRLQASADWGTNWGTK